jgi:hypothetical protein
MDYYQNYKGDLLFDLCRYGGGVISQNQMYDFLSYLYDNKKQMIKKSMILHGYYGYYFPHDNEKFIPKLCKKLKYDMMKIDPSNGYTIVHYLFETDVKDSSLVCDELKNIPGKVVRELALVKDKNKRTALQIAVYSEFTDVVLRYIRLNIYKGRYADHKCI